MDEINNGLSRKAPLFILTHEFHPVKGGIATFTEEMALSASRMGFDVEVWAPSTPTEVDLDKNWPFTVRRLDLKGTQDWPCRLAISKEIIDNRQDLRNAIVYLPEPGPISAVLYLQFIKAFQPGHLYLTFHGSEILNYHRRIHHRIMLGKLIERADRISVVSQFTHRLLTRRFPEAKSKTILTPCALRSDFTPMEGATAPDEDKVVILTVGRLHPRKGQHRVIKALGKLPPDLRQRVEYWIVGTDKKGEYLRELKSLIRQSDVSVKLLGNINDEELEAVYRQANIFAMTSIHYKNSVEGFGLVYLEAASCGLPVVAHRVGGVPDAVINEQTGLLVPPRNPAALTHAFQRLIEDPKLRRKLGEQGKQWSQVNRWDRSVEALFLRPELKIGVNNSKLV